MLKCIEVVLVYVGSKLPCVFIFNEITSFLPSNVYLRGSINRDIHTHDDEMRMDEGVSPMLCFHHAALCSFVFSSHSVPINKKKYTYINVVKGVHNSSIPSRIRFQYFLQNVYPLLLNK